MREVINRRGFKYEVGIKKNTLAYRLQLEDYIEHLLRLLDKEKARKKKWYQFWK